MNSVSLEFIFPAVFTHIASVGLCAIRLLPIAFLCPLFGGAVAPTPVRLSVVLSLALALHGGAGVTYSMGGALGWWTLGAAMLKELAFGLSIGVIASLPFDAARMGGRFIDLFRGSSAEASLPHAGTKEAATGDVLYQMLVALAVTSFASPWVLSGVWKSFAAVPLGQLAGSEAQALYVVELAGHALSTGLAIGAPVAGAVMALDCVVAMAARAAPQMNLPDSGVPLRILGGGAVLWLGLGVMSERLLAELMDVNGWLSHFIELSR